MHEKIHALLRLCSSLYSIKYFTDTKLQHRWETCTQTNSGIGFSDSESSSSRFLHDHQIWGNVLDFTLNRTVKSRWKLDRKGTILSVTMRKQCLYPRYRSKTPWFPALNPFVSSINLKKTIIGMNSLWLSLTLSAKLNR